MVSPVWFLGVSKILYRNSFCALLHSTTGHCICVVWLRHSQNLEEKNCWKSKTKRLLSRSRRKSLKIFITILVCFAFCWLPDHVAYFLIDDNEEFRDCGLPRDIYYVSLFFPHAISALNPCIYIIFNQDFRSGTKDLLIMCRRVLFRLNELVDSRNRSSCNDKMSWDEEKQSEIYPLHSLKTRRPPKMSTEYCKSYV